MQLSEEAGRRRMLWAARRGMLELDLLLSPYVESCYTQLTMAEQRVLERLLECQDQDLYQWLIGRVPAPDSELQAMVSAIIAHARRAPERY
jgi:antitoxin CptB